MFIVADRVRETSITEGSGSVTLNGPYGAFQSFASGIGNGNETYYAIENNSDWEVGRGTFNAGILSRTEIYDSSTGGSKIDLLGTSTVFCTLPASKAFVKDPNGYVLAQGMVALEEINVSGLTSNWIQNSGDMVVGGNTLMSGDLTVLGDLDFTFGGNIVANNITATGMLMSSGFLTLVRPNSAGNFLHAYKQDGIRQTIALYVDSNISPLWRFGLKTNPNSRTASPTFGYVYGRDGAVGLVGNTENSISLSDSAGFLIRQENALILDGSRDQGFFFDECVAAAPIINVVGDLLQTEDLQRWKVGVTTLAIVDSGGRFGIRNTSPEYELDIAGSGRMTTICVSGIYFKDGTFQNTAASGVGGGSETTFGSDLTVVLADGKSFGKYANGSTIPASGLTAAQVIELAVLEALDPSASLSASPARIETGQSSCSVTLSFIYTINNPGEAVDTVSLEFRRNNTGAWAVLSTDTGLTNYVHNFTNSTDEQVNYRYVVTDTLGSTVTVTDNVDFDYQIFYGPVSSVPVSSADVRALPNTRFLSAGNTFNLNTGTTEVNFTVAMPATQSISEVLDLDALNANITAEYINNVFNVNDGGGNPVAYNVYTMTVAIPYSTNHRHQVTKG